MRMFREFIVMMSAVAGCACTAVPAMADEVAESRTEGTAGDGMECVGWAIPHISAAHVRTEPRHGAEMSTQALMGWPVRVLDRLPEGWSHVELPDGYRGYIIDNSLTFMPSDSLALWVKSPRVIATNVIPVMATDDSGCAVTDIVQGDIAVALACDTLNTFIELPDGRRAFLQSSMCETVETWRCSVADREKILSTASALTGVPYLWGGLTAKGMDCSGLTRLAYLAEGIMLPRDASQQALAGEEIDRDSVAPADLLFFASEKTGRIHPVALYAGHDTMIEAAGRVRLSPVPWPRVVHIRRILLEITADFSAR